MDERGKVVAVALGILSNLAVFMWVMLAPGVPWLRWVLCPLSLAGAALTAATPVIARRRRRRAEFDPRLRDLAALYRRTR